MAMRKIGTRVLIKSGMSEFIGKRGTITYIEGTGNNAMYRVRLDTPVNVRGVGLVADDLWSSSGLETIKRGKDATLPRY